ncbi:hypothetical protein C2U65_09170 [Acinetobacter baumannii]|uniref:hypothetical protein n=1 Tax=Acinetobacter baumannii TaxID=470 RepID=UPI000DE7A6D8|nr:hypothetical protein [Acinetobacter baumannii]MBF6721637.1 hypothetical protein [Acinetobacter baumannii]MBF6799265.1 hypothetical protein [Acinetobacter baumannii]MBF6951844.1 hypothetical protein [Acinetobacter baumannii]MBF6967442.1 hypothetical protein [Acinetobacter baumannii]MBF8382584.1 hypothetical protein [Acinetobacter baumannii]
MFFKKEKVEKTITRGNYVVILHSWFVDDKGFKHFEFSDLTRAEVEKEAKALQHDHYDTFNKCAFYILKVE